jgi:hypothetical protein
MSMRISQISSIIQRPGRSKLSEEQCKTPRQQVSGSWAKPVQQPLASIRQHPLLMSLKWSQLLRLPQTADLARLLTGNHPTWMASRRLRISQFWKSKGQSGASTDRPTNQREGSSTQRTWEHSEATGIIPSRNSIHRRKVRLHWMSSSKYNCANYIHMM